MAPSGHSQVAPSGVSRHRPWQVLGAQRLATEILISCVSTLHGSRVDTCGHS